jgi:DNA-binding MarR family transcriptional regulator
MTGFIAPPEDHGRFPGVDPLSQEVFRAFTRATHAHRHLMARKMSAYNVHPAQMFCLSMIAHADGITQRDLAEKLHVARPTLTVMLHKMEKSGYIERRADENDQRYTRIYLAPAGSEIHEEVHGIMAEAIGEMTRGLTQDELRQLAGLLGKLGDSMEGTNDTTETPAT